MNDKNAKQVLPALGDSNLGMASVITVVNRDCNLRIAADNTRKQK